MKNLLMIVAAASLLVGSAAAEWDFDVHGAEIAKPRMAMNQAQRALFLAGLELDLSDPLPSPVVLDPLEEAFKSARLISEQAAQALQEAASR